MLNLSVLLVNAVILGVQPKIYSLQYMPHELHFYC